MSGPCLASDPTINLTYDQNGLVAAPILDPATDNALQCRSSGLYAPSYFGPVARYANSAGQSIPNATLTQLVLDTTRYEGWSPTLRSSGVITIPVTGTYAIGFALFWTSNIGYRTVQVRNINTAVPVCGDHFDSLLCSAMSAEGQARFLQGDQLACYAYHNAGGAAAIAAALGNNWSLFDVWIALVEVG